MCPFLWLSNIPLCICTTTSLSLICPWASRLLPSSAAAAAAAAAAPAKSLQLCPTLCNPIDGSPPGSPIPGILQARTLEWGCHFLLQCMKSEKCKVKVKPLSHVRHLATPWTAAHQAPPSMGFSRQEYWSGVPLPSPSLGSRETNKFMI